MRVEYSPHYDGGYSIHVYPFSEKPYDWYAIDVRFTEQNELQGIGLDSACDNLSIEQIQRFREAIDKALQYARKELKTP